MTIEMQTKVIKGNNKNTGFIRLPYNLRMNYTINEDYKINLTFDSKFISFFGKVKNYSGLGFYIPAKIVQKYSLMTKNVNIKTKKLEGFHTTLGCDGRLYIPCKIGNKLKLRNKIPILVEGKINDKTIKKYSLVFVRKHKKKENEYMIMMGPEYARLPGIFQIKEITNSKNLLNKQIQSLIKDYIHTPIDKNKTIIFYGNRRPVIINNNLILSNFAHYLGCYFADGTKKGTSWAISASTFKQAKYFINSHNSIILNRNVKFDLTYTCYDEFGDKSRLILKDKWKDNTGVIIDKIRHINSKVKTSENRNIYGSLRIKENKELTLLIYNKILHNLIDTIIKNRNKDLALNFICGVLEGDGSPNAKSKGHIHISTNKFEIKTLKEIFTIAGFKCKGYLEGKNKATIRIGLLEIIDNLKFLQHELFKYYPKRRQKMIRRIFNTGTVKYLVGEQKNTSGFVKSILKKSNILDKRHYLTNKGKEIRNILLNLKEEIK